MDFPQTPLQRLGLDERGNELWIKRDDLLPFSFGGNKARIAAEYMDDMRAKGSDHMIAYGNARSNLCRTLSNLCAASQVPCTILLPADDDGSRADSYNLLLSRSFGAELVPCQKTDVAAAVDAALAASAAKGRRPYYIYGDRTGGGNLETPVRAYRKVWRELCEQQRALSFAFDALYLATGTGMTQAGLLCGRSDDERPMEIVGISIARSAESAAAHIRDYLRAAIGDKSVAQAGAIDVVDNYALAYGETNDDMRACARWAMRRYGVPLDLTYTGKAFYGMTKELARRQVAGKRVLFLHTGGAPLFFDTAREVFA